MKSRTPARITETAFNILNNNAPVEVTAVWRDEDLGLSARIRETGLKSVAFHRDRLGPHTRMARGNKLYHAWDRPEWSVFVNDSYGAKFEVVIPSTRVTFNELDKYVSKAIRAWHDYMQALGFSSKVALECAFKVGYDRTSKGREPRR